MEQVLVNENKGPYSQEGVWSQDEFMRRIKEHEQHVSQITDMERLAMVKGGSIGQNIEAMRKRKILQALILSRQVNAAKLSKSEGAGEAILETQYEENESGSLKLA